MKRFLLVLFCITSSPSLAEIWATGECVTARGSKISYMLHDGNGWIDHHDGLRPSEIFSTRDGNMGIIRQIGDSGNLVLAVDLNTGRGYVITQFDNGRKVENNVSCRLGTINR